MNPPGIKSLSESAVRARSAALRRVESVTEIPYVLLVIVEIRAP